MSRSVYMASDGSWQTRRGIDAIVNNGEWLPEEQFAVGKLTLDTNGEVEPDDDVYGFYQVNVVVKGGGDCEILDTTASGELRPVKVKVGAAPVGKFGGGSILGKGEDGNMLYVRVDENGKVVKKTVPSRLRLVAPDKMNYVEGDTIDYSGASVTLLYEDGTIAKSYASGTIKAGTSSWDRYVVVPETVPDGYGKRRITVAVLPFWLHNGELMGAGNGLSDSFEIYVAR